MKNLMFASGSARGGTGLITRMLSVGDQAEIALDPYLELYKQLRKAIILNNDPNSKFNFDSPIDSYYFANKKLKILDLITDSDLSLNFNLRNLSREDFNSRLAVRAKLSSGDLINEMHKVEGKTFKDTFINAADLIAKKRGQKKHTIIGIHENWTPEFLIPLAKTFPEAKFMIVIRDPRAAITSNFKVKELTDRVHAISFARCLRKNMAFAIYLKKHKKLKNRFMSVRYEDVVLEPEKLCIEMCKFLEIKYRKSMVCPQNYVEPSNGKVYNGFSSYESKAQDINVNRIYRWKRNLDPKDKLLIDFICGPEMTYFGYKPTHDFKSSNNREEIFEIFKNDYARDWGWRIELCSLEKEFENEMVKWEILNSPHSSNHKEIRKNFLYEEVLREIL